MSLTRNTVAFLALALTAGCELLVRIDPSEIASGGGGAGGATTTTMTTTSVTTSTTTSTTTTTTTTTTGCMADSDCPAAPSSMPCITAACDTTTGLCSMPFVAAGDLAAASAQVTGNCKKVICDGAGNPSSVPDDTNKGVSSNPCVTYGCSGGNSVTSFSPGTTPCTSTTGGKVCGDPAGAKAGTCVSCNVIGDCGANMYCQNNTCVGSTCMNGVQDPGETDVDCGGPCGPTCAVGQHCYATGDCQSGDCQGASPPTYGICVTATCSDGIENQGETDVDCGGMTCGPAGRLCGTGKGCKSSADCQSDDCTPESNCPSSNCTGVCLAPTCFDGIQNENETDLDCGGPNCAGTCATTKKCKIDGDCVSGDGCETGANVCIAMCSDLHVDGMETDIDCGGGACNTCVNGKKCKADSDCQSNACDGTSLLCTANQCADHRQDGMETDIDCGGAGACPRCNGGQKCVMDSDCIAADGCATPGNTCIGSCQDGHVDGVETDVDCGGANTCNRCLTGKKCQADTDCVTGDGCLTGGNTCAVTCQDGHKDGNETDIDCGGNDACNRCGNGKACAADSDCTSNACDALSLLCVASQCTDNRQDGSETDVDCGGANTCSRCANGLMCAADSDCASSACDANSLRCVSNPCADHRQDGNETDIDCGGVDSCNRCAVGQKCLADTDCVSNACDGITLKCDANQCTDNRQDGVETDIDCGGTNSCSRCPNAKKCVIDGDCTSNACDFISLKCVADQCQDHRLDGVETDVDCGGGTCPKCALTLTCNGDSDCASNACDANTNKCIADQCLDHRQDGKETDVDCGGGTCLTCVNGLKCVVDSDCMSNACDGISHVCVANQCADNRQDGVETDIDCGGANLMCARCNPTQKCLLDSDCIAGTDGCKTPGGVCIAACQDGHQDNVETDVDCGGGTCLTCPVGDKCLQDSDCTTNACDAISFKCVSSQCIDHQQDGVETDQDCGGGACPKCLAGLNCTQSSDCTSNNCSGGVCLCAQNSDCTTNACDVNTLMCIANQCTDNHKDGAETDVDCGGGTCAKCPVGDTCSVSSDCASNDCFSGTCLCVSDADCPSNACDANTLLCVPDQCMDHRQDGTETDVDCGGSCSTKCPVGEKCSQSSDCTSNDCVGGICQCLQDSDCPSNACDAVSNLCVSDQCADHHQDGAETDVDCGGTTCAPCLAGESCLQPTDCTSGDCFGGICECLADSDCATNACDLTSNNCVANQCIDKHKDGAETDVDCGGGTCPKCPVGDKCSQNSDCTSNDCVAGTCQCLSDADCSTNACDANTHLCVTDQCMDHQQDGAESDVDCGGGMCPTCQVGEKCTQPTDCASGSCVLGLCRCTQDSDCTTNACDVNNNLCVANQCIDHQTDGMETDVDCGGGMCPKCLAGKACMTGTDCTSGSCVGNVCQCLSDSDCTTNACDTNSKACVTDQCADNHKDGSETDVDCGGPTCPKCGLTLNCNGDSDCASNACDGISNTCVLSQCSDNRKDGAETDVDCGGGTCLKCALGLNCNGDSDCLSNACDGISNKCVLSQCADNRQDGNETDIDCGGGNCFACPLGDKCSVNSDCQSTLCNAGTCGCKVNSDCTSTFCDTVTHQCVASQCQDQAKDGNETDVDCGGGTCPTCALGSACSAGSDCVSTFCAATSKLCVASQCLDQTKDGNETDVDCGGGTCSACLAGLKCSKNSDCTSNTCTGGTCLCKSTTDCPASKPSCHMDGTCH